MVEKSLSLQELNIIYMHYNHCTPQTIYKMKKRVNHIMMYKMCKSNHKTKYDKIIKILRSRNLFSKNKKYKYANTLKSSNDYRRMRKHNSTRNTSPISYLLM